MEQMLKSEVIVVDEEDKQIGKCDKYKAHRLHEDPQLHRAFSLFLFDNSSRLLIQQRSANKLTFPLIWANTCCSHPEPGEDVIDAVRRRTLFELGIDLSNNATLQEVGVFHYEAVCGEWIEKEIDHVIFGFYDTHEVNFNKDEIKEIKWITKEELNKDIEINKDKYSPWFIKIADKWLNNNWEEFNLTKKIKNESKFVIKL